MHSISSLIRKTYKQVPPFAGIDSVRNELFTEGALVVNDEERFWGVLTPEDLAERDFRIVADCIRLKPFINPHATVQDAVDIMQSEGFQVLPVGEDDESFEGLIYKSDLMDSLCCSLREQNEQIHMLAHDLKSPLSSVESYAALLREKGEDLHNNEALEYLLNSCRSARSIIEDLLEAGNLESDSSDLPLQPVNLSQIARELYHNHSLSAEKKGIRFTVNIPSSPIYISGNPDKMRRVFDNLISNSLKFTEKGKKVELLLETNYQQAFVTVKDEGIGIAESDQKVLFQKFSALRRKGLYGEKSTGLGLYIVKKITELHGGTINLISNPGTGTTVHLAFPLLDGNGATLPDEQKAGKGSSSGSNLLLYSSTLLFLAMGTFFMHDL